MSEDMPISFLAHKIFHEFSMLIHEKFIKHFKILFGLRLRNFSFATVQLRAQAETKMNATK